MKAVLRIGGSVLGSPPSAKLVNAYADVNTSATSTTKGTQSQ